jgi:hypothetical protein
MQVCGMSPETARDLLSNPGKTPTPLDMGRIYRRPAYEAPEYRYEVKDWMNTPGLAKHGQKTITLDFSSGSEVDLGDFGQSHLAGNVGLNAGPWFSVHAGGSSDHEEKVTSSISESGGFKVTMTYDEMVAVPVTPGLWYVRNGFGGV